MKQCPKCLGSGKLVRSPPRGLERYVPYGYDRPFECYICGGKGEID